MRAVVSQVTLNDAMGDRRAEIEAQRRREHAADPRFLSFGHPGAGHRDQAGRPAGRGQRRVQAGHGRAAARASRYVNNANAYALQLRQKAQGDATAFDKVYAQYKLAPEVTRRRMYYETMEQVLSQDRQDDRRGARRDAVPAAAAGAEVAAAARSGSNDRPRSPPRRCSSAVIAVHRCSCCCSAASRSSPRPSRRSSFASASRSRILNQYKPGRPIGAAGAGINCRIPFVDQFVWIDKRVQDVDMQRQQVLSTDQRRLEVDAFARYRIVDPLLMYIRAGTEEQLREQLRPILGSEVRNELGRIEFASLLTPERQGIMDSVRTSLNRIARQYGVEVLDVRIKRTDLPDGAPLAVGLRPHAHGARAGSALDPRPRREAGADHPGPGRRRRRANLCRKLRQGPANSTISIARCRAIGSRSSATDRTSLRRRPSSCRRRTTI